MITIHFINLYQHTVLFEINRRNFRKSDVLVRRHAKEVSIEIFFREIIILKSRLIYEKCMKLNTLNISVSSITK